MAITPVPALTPIPAFPALSDRAEGTYNSKAFEFGSHMATKFNQEVAAVAQNVVSNANEILTKVTSATDAAATAVAAAAATKDAAADAASALASRQAAAQSASSASQSATSAFQAKQSVDQSLASVAGGPVISINGRTGVVAMKEFSTGDVIVSARTDYKLPDYLPCDGGTYLRSSYPNLAALLPVQYPTSKITNNSPSSAVSSFSFSSDGTFLAIGHASGLTVLKKSSTTLWLLHNNSSGSPWVTNYVYAVAFSDDGTYLAVAIGDGSGPYLAIYKRSGDVFTRLTIATASLPTGSVFSLAFNSTASRLAIGIQGGLGGILIYARSGDTFTKTTNPSELPTGNVNAVEYSPGGGYLAIGQTNSRYLMIYNASTFITVADPDDMPTGQVICLAWSPDTNYLAVGSQGTVRLRIYKRDGAVFTLIATPAVGTSGSVLDVEFSKNGQYLAVATSSSERGILFRRVGDAFNKMTPPEDYITSANAVAFAPDSLTMAFGTNTSPYLTMYRVDYDTNTRFRVPVQTIDGSGLAGFIKT